MSQPIRGQVDHLVFPIDPKNTNFVEDVDILLPVKYCWILFSGLRREVENNSANQRPRRPSCFFPIGKKKKHTHKLGRGCWDLASCQVSLNSVQRLQGRSWKCLSQSEAILFFRLARKKNHISVEDVEILLPVKFRWIPLSGFTGEVENVSADQRLGRPSCFSDRPKKGHKLGRGRCGLASYKVWLNSVKRFLGRSRKCLSQSEAREVILFFRSAQKTNFVENVEILLLIKFRWILFSGFRGKVENVSAHQRLGRPSCFSDRPKTPHKFGRGGWDLASCQVSLNSVQWFQREVENISANQRPGRPSCFSDRPKNTNLVEDV